MSMQPLRLQPGDDLRRALEAAIRGHGCEAAFVVAGIGSLRDALLRYAGRDELTPVPGDSEILTLSGSIGLQGSHLHMSLSDAQGGVFGGHVPYGCTVRTTVEALVELMPDWSLTREHDAATGFDELAIRPRNR